jgi:hypothetical protein
MGEFEIQKFIVEAECRFAMCDISYGEYSAVQSTRNGHLEMPVYFLKVQQGNSYRQTMGKIHGYSGAGIARSV